MDMWTITIVGVGTVFLTLIGLYLVLLLFKLLISPKPQSVAALPVDTAPAAKADLQNGLDGNVVAAIVAAVAAASGRPSAAFRIASIEPAGFSTPVWGHVDRLARRSRGV
jgi:sodium pump decarboxylase gamma subunit